MSPRRRGRGARKISAVDCDMRDLKAPTVCCPSLWLLFHSGRAGCMRAYLGKPTHTLGPCWTPKPLPPRNECTGWFALAYESICVGF